MKKPRWSKDEIQYLIENHQRTSCHVIALHLKRTTKSVQHKYNELGLDKGLAKVGDIIKEWKIEDIFYQHNGNQNVAMAKIKSIVSDEERVVRRSLMTNRQISKPCAGIKDRIYKNFKHGKSKTRLFSIWAGMKSRCSNTKQGSYDNYGGRGIKVCDDWLIFGKFEIWAKESGYKDNLTLDRIDVNRDYCPENCRWATKLEQTINKRNTENLYLEAFGENKHVIEWSHDPRCKVSHLCLKYRIRAGWNPEDAITKEPERKRKPNLINWLKKNHPEIYIEYKKL